MKKLKTVLATVMVLGLLAGAAFAQGMGDESGGTSGGVTNPSGDMNMPGGAMNTPSGPENTPSGGY